MPAAAARGPIRSALLELIRGRAHEALKLADEVIDARIPALFRSRGDRAVVQQQRARPFDADADQVLRGRDAETPAVELVKVRCV